MAVPKSISDWPRTIRWAATVFRSPSIARRLTISLVVAVVITSGIGISMSHIYEIHHTRGHVEEAADNSIASLARVLEMPVWNFDQATVKSIARARMDGALVTRTRVVDSFGTVLFFESEEDGHGDEVVERTAPILHEGREIGQVEMAFTLGYLEKTGQQSLWSCLVIVLTNLIVLSVAVAFLIPRFFRKPMQQVTDIAKRYGRGEYEATGSEEEGAAQEFRPVMSTLGSMARAIQCQAAALQRSEQRYRATLDGMLEGCQVIDYDWRYAYLNDAAARHGRRAKEELLGHAMMEMYPGIEDTEMFADIRSCMEKHIPHQRETLFTYRDGSQGWFELSIEPTHEGVLILSVDITERKRAEEALSKAHRALSVLGQCNQALVHSTDETAFLQEVCRIIVEAGGYTLAWVGSAERDERKTVRPVAQRGLEDGYLETLELTWADTERGRGPTGSAIRSGKASVIRDISTDPTYAIWRDEATKRGYASSVALPLISGEEPFGVLNIYAREPDAFGQEEINLLTELAGDLAYGIASLRSRAERDKAEERLTAYLENAPDGIFVSDTGGTILYGNRKAEEMTGYRREELIGKSLPNLNVLSREYLARATKLLELNAYGQSTGPEELELTRKDGTHLCVEASATPVRQNEETVVIGIVRDITERKEMEGRIQRQNEFLNSVIESLPHPFYVIDANDYTISVANSMAGMDRLPGAQACYALTHRRSQPCRGEEGPCPLERVKESRGPVTVEHTHYDVDGNRRDMEVHAYPILDGQGNVVRMIEYCLDITERKRMHEQMMVADRLSSVGQLASGIAHELNNPLTGIIGFASLLSRKSLPDDVKQDLDVILREAQRATRVVKNVLTFARKHAPDRQPQDINAIIERLLDMRTYEQRVSNVQANTHLAPGLPHVTVDGFQLQQAFLNIIINAEYFMTQAHRGGILTVTSEMVEDTIRISFADDGPGIAPENLHRVFDPFFTTKAVGDGTGLGLSICHGTIAAHKGSIHVESPPGKGSTFIVELPMSD